MLSAVWELFENLIRALFSVGGALLRVGFQLLSALASLVLLPFRAAWGLLFGDWGALDSWTQGYLVLCGLVVLAFLGLALYGWWRRRREL